MGSICASATISRGAGFVHRHTVCSEHLTHIAKQAGAASRARGRGRRARRRGAGRRPASRTVAATPAAATAALDAAAAGDSAPADGADPAPRRPRRHPGAQRRSPPPTRSSTTASGAARGACSPGPPTAPPTSSATAIRPRRRSRAPRAPTSASSGSPTPDSPTPRTSPTRTGSPTATGCPTTSSRCSTIAEYSYGVEVAPGPARLGAAEARPRGLRRRPEPARGHLPQAARQRGPVRLRGARPGQGGRAASTATWCSTTTTRPSELRLRRPDDPGQRHLRARVQPPAAAELRQLPGRLDVRVDRDLGRGARSTRTINDYLNYVPASSPPSPARR